MASRYQTIYEINGSEVDFDEWMRIERLCGFGAPKGKPATAGFMGYDADGKQYRGRIRHERRVK